MDGVERSDGRTAAQIRSVNLERRTLSRADGSAVWSQGGTSVLAAVHGPLQAPSSAREDAERCVLEVVWKPRAGLAGPAEREAEQVVRRSLEAMLVAALMPRTLVQVVVQVLSDDGGVLACALNAACAALVDAAVPMSQLLSAVSVATSTEGSLLLDPCKAEEAQAGALATLAFAQGGGAAEQAAAAGHSGGVLTLHSRGAMSAETLHDIIAAARAGSERLAAFQHLAVTTTA